MSHVPDVIGCVFTKKGEHGDFEWMIFQEEFNNSLFIFNDNEHHMNSIRKGGGSACIRPFNFLGFERAGFDFPRSVGIVTGRSTSGYQNLKDGQISIDYCFDILNKVLKKHAYDAIYFPEGKGGLIGSSIFSVSSEVLVYITRRLRNL